jgi:integrase/recombinase XerD
MDPGDGRGILQRPALDIASQAVNDPRIPKRVAAVLLLRESSRLRLGPGVRTAIRKSSCAGLVRVEHRRTRSRQRTVAGKRAFTKNELQDFFDHADDKVTLIAASARKGWLPAYRDSVMFKLAYSYGLRFNELRHLQTVDFAGNPHAREFGRYGVVHVRYGKAKRGSPHKRRSVLTVFDWTPEVIADWLAHGQPSMDDGIDLFPSERGALVSEDTLLRRFRRYCNDLDLSTGLDLHSLRRSYATHLIEDGWDAKFVQDQLGHEHASTTALYTCVSSDFRIRTLRRVLDATIGDALSSGEEEKS